MSVCLRESLCLYSGCKMGFLSVFVRPQGEQGQPGQKGSKGDKGEGVSLQLNMDYAPWPEET